MRLDTVFSQINITDLTSQNTTPFELSEFSDLLYLSADDKARIIAVFNELVESNAYGKLLEHLGCLKLIAPDVFAQIKLTDHLKQNILNLFVAQVTRAGAGVNGIFVFILYPEVLTRLGEDRAYIEASTNAEVLNRLVNHNTNPDFNIYGLLLNLIMVKLYNPTFVLPDDVAKYTWAEFERALPEISGSSNFRGQLLLIIALGKLLFPERVHVNFLNQILPDFVSELLKRLEKDRDIGADFPWLLFRIITILSPSISIQNGEIIIAPVQDIAAPLFTELPVNLNF